MPAYEYTAKDQSGTTVQGVFENIESIPMLKCELSKVGYTLLRAVKQSTEVKKKGGKVKQAEIVTFAYKFSGMYAAGLPIARCLEILAQQTENAAFKTVLTEIMTEVQSGTSLKTAFEKHKKVFSEFFVGMIEAGETGGKLSQTLEMSAKYLESQMELSHKVKSAFAYPVIVGILCLLIISYLVVFVVPIFSKLYKQLHVALPGPTQTLVVLSSAARNYWWLMLVIAVVGTLVFKKLKADPKVRKAWDEFKLKMPIFAKLNKMVLASRFIRTFAMMSEAGVPLIDSLAVASRVANNFVVTGITEKMQASIAGGSSIAAPMGEAGIFPPMIVQMASAGEEVGMVPEMLQKSADLMDKDIDRLIKSLLVKLEPCLTLVMGVIVGFILLGLYLPMFDYMSHLK
jgi:type IV pilus assembly protein PilC